MTRRKGFSPRRFCGPPGIWGGEVLWAGKPREPAGWFDGANAFYAHKGRVAIQKAIEILKLDSDTEILAPSYNNGSEIDPFLNAGVAVSLYRVDQTASIDREDLLRRIGPKTKAIYVTHYFGFPHPIRILQDVCSEYGLYLIEDCALSLFSKAGTVALGTFGDVAIFSLTKTLPVPDGGVLIVNNPNLAGTVWPRRSPAFSTSLRGMLPLIKAAALRWCSRRNYFWHSEFTNLGKTRTGPTAQPEIGAVCQPIRPDMLPSMYCNPNIANTKLGMVTSRLLGTFDSLSISQKRRHNFKMLAALIEDSELARPLFRSLPDGVCPLNFPLITKHRDYIVTQLKRAMIYAGAWWKGYNRSLPWDEYPEACYLKDNVLTLPTHQALDDADIEYMAKVFNLLIQRLSVAAHFVLKCDSSNGKIRDGGDLKAPDR